MKTTSRVVKCLQRPVFSYYLFPHCEVFDNSYMFVYSIIYHENRNMPKLLLR